MRPLIIILSLLYALPAPGADYAREQRWAEEILPGLVVGDPVHLDAKGHRFLNLHTEAKGAKTAVLLVHGIGVHPDHGVIGILRTGLAEAGYTTLSAQMPVLGANARGEDYPAEFAEAGARIQAAEAFLKNKGYQRVVLLSHSMGSWMSNTYLAGPDAARFTAWINLGMSADFRPPANKAMPVFDVYGEKDLPAVLEKARNRADSLASIPASRQARIALADHFYTGREEALGVAIRDFINALR